jgi:hypothetical protein
MRSPPKASRRGQAAPWPVRSPPVHACVVRGVRVRAGVIRVKDYCPSGVPDALCLGLAWDVTNGVNIDLDASAILLDDKLRQLDLVFFGKLASSDGAIRHGGDEREGDEKGVSAASSLHAHPAATRARGAWVRPRGC